ncbi:MAG: endonuclease domain-containing protein [Candidatus Uhrbacteria bacterium]
MADSVFLNLNPINLKHLRRSLRRNQTDAEGLIWQYLRNNQLGFKFYRQFGIDNYIVDFCCRNKKTVVEIDGGIHEEKDIKGNDLVISKILEDLGYKIVRFKNSEILNNPELVAEKIKKYLTTT